MAKKLIETEDFEAAEPVVDNTPRYGDQNWHDYVMSQLSEDEKPNGLPNCNGLRRFIMTHFDVITSCGQMVDRTLDTVTVNWTLKFCPFKPQIVSIEREFPSTTISAIGAATIHNTKHPFTNYLDAVADTRAEARCYRKALLLKCLAAEESQETLANTERPQETGETMSSSQEKMINTTCKRIGINRDGTLYFHEKEIKKESGDTSTERLQFSKLTKSQAAMFMNVLNQYQCNAGKTVPEEIKENK